MCEKDRQLILWGMFSFLVFVALVGLILILVSSDFAMAPVKIEAIKALKEIGDCASIKRMVNN